MRILKDKHADWLRKQYNGDASVFDPDPLKYLFNGEPGAEEINVAEAEQLQK